MKKSWKKMLSAVLTLSMVLALLPVTALAEGEAEEAVCTCTALCGEDAVNEECAVCGIGGDCGFGAPAEPETPAEETTPAEPVEETTPKEPAEKETPAEPAEEETPAEPETPAEHEHAFGAWDYDVDNDSFFRVCDADDEKETSDKMPKVVAELAEDVEAAANLEEAEAIVGAAVEDKAILDGAASYLMSLVDAYEVETQADAVAQIVGGDTYPTLLDAVNAAKEGETITLLTDYTVPALTEDSNGEYNLPKNGILDLGENKLTVPYMTAIFQGENITIQNGTVATSKGTSYALWIGNGTEDTVATVKNVTVEGGINVFVAQVTIEATTAAGSTVEGHDYYAVWGDVASDINIKSGTYQTEGTNGVVGACFESKDEDGNLVPEGKVTIEGGSFTLNNDKFAPAGNDNVVVAGGEFSQNALTAVVPYLTEDVARVLQEDGSFVVKVAPEGAVPVEGEEKLYYENDKALEANNVAKIGDTYYKTLEEAIKAVKVGEKKEIVLLKSVSTNELNIKYTKIILNLNGNQLTDSKSIVLSNGCDLTIKNGTVSSPQIALYKGNLAIENSTVESTVNVVANKYDNSSNSNHLTVAKDASIEMNKGLAIILRENTEGEKNYGSVIDVYGKLAGCLFVMGNIHTNLETAKNPCQINIHDDAVVRNVDTAIALNGAAKLTIDKATIEGITGVEVRAGELVVNGATITGTGTSIVTNPNGSGTTTTGAGIAVVQHGTRLPINVTINDGTISGFTALHEKNAETGDIKEVNIEVKDGNFKAINSGKNAVYSQDCKAFIEGGYFTSDPAEYVVTGKTSIESDKAGYAYMVGTKEAGEVTVKPATADPKVFKPTGITDEERIEAAMDAAASVDADAALTDAVKGDLSDAVKQDAVNQATATDGTGIPNAKAEDVIVYKQTFLEIRPTEFTTETTDEVTTATLKMDITPKMRIVASTATTADAIELNGDDKNALVVVQSEKLTITTPSEVTVTLPAAFYGKDVYIKHEATSGGIYYYTAKAGDDGTLTFTSEHGFSPFTFSSIDERAAVIDNIGYDSLQDAVDAVKDGQTITVLKDDQDAKVTGNKTFTLDGDGADTAKLTAGSGYKLSQDGDEYTVKKKKKSSSSGGSSSSAEKTYAVSIDDVDNGKVKADPSKAEEGEKVTITVTPDKGYEIDKVKVTDADGNKIDIKDKGNGEYTFTMPDSKVEVKATFEKAEEVPAEIEEIKKIILTIDQREALVFGETKINDVAPVIRNDRTMLPIRFVVEALGGSIAWNGAQKTATIVKGDTVMVITIGAATASVNGQPVLLDAPAFIENSRTYLPLRFVAENLDAQVTWDAETKQVIIIPNEYLK